MIVRKPSEATNGARMERTAFASQLESSGRSSVGKYDNSSASSTPFVSAPSSPTNSSSAWFMPSAFPETGWEACDGGKSGMRGSATRTSMDDGTEVRTKNKPASSIAETDDTEDFLAFSATGSDFDFSARYSEADGSIWSPAPMSSADELFYNGQIRPLQLLSPVQLESGLSQPTASRVDDGFFDFRSSANYTLPSPRSPAVPSKHAQKVQGFELAKPASHVGPPATDKWQKMGKATRPIDPTREKPPGSSERTRRGKERGSHRRGRSLSPLRVFHIDDAPRLSCESDTANISWKSPVESETDSRKSWTLKELLHGGDSGEFESLSAKGEKRSSNGGIKSVVMGYVRSVRKATPTSSPSPSVSKSKNAGSKPTISPHELHYTSQRAQAEQMRKRTSLPYRQGLLGCLGFSSRNYRSFAGLHPLHPS